MVALLGSQLDVHFALIARLDLHRRKILVINSNKLPIHVGPETENL